MSWGKTNTLTLQLSNRIIDSVTFHLAGFSMAFLSGVKCGVCTCIVKDIFLKKSRPLLYFIVTIQIFQVPFIFNHLAKVKNVFITFPYFKLVKGLKYSSFTELHW